MLKIGHACDFHAGYKAGNFIREDGLNVREYDGYVALSKVIDGFIEEEVDAVVIAGDVFHTPKPEARTIVFVQNQLRRLHKAGIKTYILAGNHEATDIVGDIASSKILDDDLRQIYSHAEPYALHEIVDGVYVHLVSHHTFMSQKQFISKVSPVKGAVNIFSTHGSVIDPILKMKLTTEQSPREIVIPDELLMRGWDYLMLGHIHDRGWVETQYKDAPNVYYNGSTIRRGFSDPDSKLGKGWTLWKINADGTFSFDFKNVEQRPQYDFPLIDARDLSASEITDLILGRIRETQVNGTELDLDSAPILRQKIVGITGAKDSALDRSAISKEVKHCLSWKMESTRIPSISLKDDAVDQEVSEPGDDTNREAGSSRASMSMVDSYNDWVKKSQALSDFTNRDVVLENARRFIKQGEEAVLDNAE